MRSTTPGHIRVLLVDDHELVRTGLCMLIEREPHISVVGEAADHESAVHLASDTQPDIILLDLDLQGESSVRFLPDLLQAAPSARVIVVTGARAAEEHQRAVSAGAMGVVRKEQASEVLLQAIEAVHGGAAWLEPTLVARVLTVNARQQGGADVPADPETAKIDRLTTREREVIMLIGEGLHNRQIAARLKISEATVSHHLTSIFAKLELASRFDLVVYAYRHGLAEPLR
jgi:two-component system, NarL family, nitrate/nitrite response regulator NarL